MTNEPHCALGPLLRALNLSALHSGAFLVASLIAWFVILPVQDALLPSNSGIAILIYLPFGVKVISAFFEGWKSMLYLFPGGMLVQTLLGGLPLTDPSSYIIYCICFGTAPLVFATFDWATLQDRREERASISWRKMIAAGFLSSVLGALTLHFFGMSSSGEAEKFKINAVKFIVGDMLGFIALLTTLPPLLTYFLRRKSLQ